jgi:putative acetyltransferase
MGAIHRLATLDDACCLYLIRRRSILELAPPSMVTLAAEVWAAKLTLAGMERKLRDLEIWVAELDEAVAGWGAIRGGYLEGLYTAPEFAGCGVGGDLLDMLERLMRARGIPAVESEASSNALAFYIRRGYRENGPQTQNGAWPIAKML